MVLSQNLQMLRIAFQTPVVPQTIRPLVEELLSMERPTANLGGKKKRGTVVDAAVQLAAKEPTLTKAAKEEFIAYAKTIEQMRLARIRAIAQIVVTAVILLACIYVVYLEVNRTEVRKEWLGFASGLIGTVLGYWLR